MRLVPFRPTWGLLDDMMDDMMSNMPSVSNQTMKNFIPAMDVYETAKEVIVEAPLAGVNPNDVSVTVEKGVLTLEGKSNKEHEVDEKNYYRKEVRSGSFYREVSLPTSVLEDKVVAEFEDGMLKVICPKAEPTTAKKVSVKVVKKSK